MSNCVRQTTRYCLAHRSAVRRGNPPSPTTASNAKPMPISAPHDAARQRFLTGLLDERSPGAAAMGAVNTVVVSDHRLIGHNTDATGFARAASELVAGSGG